MVELYLHLQMGSTLYEIYEPVSKLLNYIGNGHPTFNDGNSYSAWVYKLLIRD